MRGEQILDLTKVVKQRRKTCHHHYQTRKNKIERCVHCGDEFPCRRECTHLDCAERRVELGIGDWPNPDTYPLSCMYIAEDGITILWDGTNESEDDFDIESVL